MSSIEAIRKIVLSNGVTIVLDRMPHVRSASIGLWINAGSRNETDAECGLSHFIEHMFFKGTTTRNAYRLSADMNALGGNFNAFTTHENVCLSAKIVDEHLARAADLLVEMYRDSLFAPEEIERERNVILEEVAMYEDTPDELVVDVFMDHLYAGNPLGRPILGKVDNIERFNQQDIATFMGKEFSPDRLVVSIAGNFDQRRIEPHLRKLLEPLGTVAQDRNPYIAPVPAYHSHTVDRKLNQVHFCMGTTGPHLTNDDRFAFAVLSTILGGGTSSRIFQEVREKRGLAYSIGTFDIMFRDSGCFAVSGGTSPKNVAKVVDLCLGEIKRAYHEPITDDEITSAKEQLKSGLLLGLESSSTRMGRMAECEIFFNRYVTVDSVLDRINAITAQDIHDVAEKYLHAQPVTFAGVGPEKRFEPFVSGMAF